MNKEQVVLLGEYIKAGKSAILIEEIPESIIEKGAIVINSDCRWVLSVDFKKTSKFYKNISNNM